MCSLFVSRLDLFEEDFTALVSHFQVVVCRNKAMQTVTNVFITNLALSDILVSDLDLTHTIPIDALLLLDVLSSRAFYTYLSLWQHLASGPNPVPSRAHVTGHFR